MNKLTDDEVFWSVAGAGASMYSWYRRFDIDEENLVLVVAIEHPDKEHHVVERQLKPSNIRTAFQELHGSGYPGVAWLNPSDPDMDSDVDDEVADCILQHAVLGRVVYG